MQKATQELAEGKPAQAAESQAKAQENLQKALEALNEATKDSALAKTRWRSQAG